LLCPSPTVKAETDKNVLWFFGKYPALDIGHTSVGASKNGPEKRVQVTTVLGKNGPGKKGPSE